MADVLENQIIMTMFWAVVGLKFAAALVLFVVVRFRTWSTLLLSGIVLDMIADFLGILYMPWPWFLAGTVRIIAWSLILLGFIMFGRQPRGKPLAPGNAPLGDETDWRPTQTYATGGHETRPIP